ncbi:hypothetical protein LTR08_004535 [Meristemomyces frigidus]|nr:hypothetical protein LTR08_004535 [Meristemomyces frigidus]
MDIPFDITGWQPTKPPSVGEEDITEDVTALVSTLSAQTEHIYRYPYDPNGWFRRGETLARLRYPELAVGDSYKAILLCHKLLKHLVEDKQWRLGSHMGFWLLDDPGDDPGADDLEAEGESNGTDVNGVDTSEASSSKAVADANEAVANDEDVTGATVGKAKAGVKAATARILADHTAADSGPANLADRGVTEPAMTGSAVTSRASTKRAARDPMVADVVDARWEQEAESGCRDDLEQRMLDLLSEAQLLEHANLDHYPEYEEGCYRQRLYPWMHSRHRRRSDGLVAEMSHEFAAAERKIWKECPDERPGDPGALAPCCTVIRHAFGEFSTIDKDSSELLGVFATKDIATDTVIVIDETETWGCIGPGKDGSMSNLHGGGGCADPIHPNLPSEDVCHDLRWIRDRAGRHAAEIILRCRFLICCIHGGQQNEFGHPGMDTHPLDHPLIARLTPNYRREKVRLFSLDHDIAIPNDLLLLHGVDIFASPNYDTWVLFTLCARIENNSWSDPIHTCISPLFSLFNHSCEPNVDWSIRPDHTTMVIRVAREVTAGEQLFVEYDGFMQDQPLAARRKRMRKWLDAECQCTKCLRQEVEEEKASKESCTCGCGGCKGEMKRVVPAWDMDELPVFPEDADGRPRVWS